MAAKPAKKGGKKKKKKASGPAVVAACDSQARLPPIAADVRWATLQSAVICRDATSLSRLVTHYNYRKDLAKPNIDQTTLILTAVKMNDLPCLQQLLSYSKIDINNRESSMVGGHAAIHLACSNDLHAVLEILLQAGADPDLKADSTIGETALMICCKLDRLRCAQMLLRKGASMGVRDNFGNNASFWAYRHNHMALARELGLPAMHTPSAEEFLALQVQRVPGFTLLPAIKKKVSKKDKDGKKSAKK